MIAKNELSALTDRKFREGALLQITWPDQISGYADLHPLLELGDEILDHQLTNIQLQKPTAILEQAIFLARRDAEARSKGKSLFSPDFKIKNNLTVSSVDLITDSFLEEIVKEGYGTIKLKCGIAPDKEFAAIEKITKLRKIKVRPDFNGQGNFASLSKFLQELKTEGRFWIEYIEDPFNMKSSEDLQNWVQLRSLVPLALDQIWWPDWNFRPPIDVLVVKPVRGDLGKSFNHIKRWSLKWTMTSSMDHPVGIMHAASIAHDYLKQNSNLCVGDFGFLTHPLFESNEWSQMMPTMGSWLFAGKGFGIGFDELWNNLEGDLNWQTIL